MRLLEPKATIVFVFFLNITNTKRIRKASINCFCQCTASSCRWHVRDRCQVFLHLSICTECCPVAFVRVWRKADYYPKSLSENDVVEQTFWVSFEAINTTYNMPAEWLLYFFDATPCPAKSRRQSTVVSPGFQFALYRVVLRLRFLRSIISLASLLCFYFWLIISLKDPLYTSSNFVSRPLYHLC